MLEVSDLVVEIGRARPVDGVSFSLGKGQGVALVGGSGSGKTLTALALMGLLPRAVTRVSGRAVLEGEGDLLSMPSETRRRLRGRRVAMVFQEPLFALDPIQTIGRQIVEAIRVHDPVSKAEAKARAKDALARMHFPDPALSLSLYPHQLSGGMRQRALIAMASAHKPSVLIADEATSALDRKVAEEIAELFLELKGQGTSLLFITHDFALVDRLCEKTVVMHAGRIVGDADPYALALKEAAR